MPGVKGAHLCIAKLAKMAQTQADKISWYTDKINIWSGQYVPLPFCMAAVVVVIKLDELIVLWSG